MHTGCNRALAARPHTRTSNMPRPTNAALYTRSCIGVFVLGVPTCMRETRSGVLLMRLAHKLRAQTSNPNYRARIEDERASLRTLIYISCTRPIC